MSINETLDELRRIANTPAEELTRKDRQIVRDLADANNVPLKRTGCASCYIDCAVELFGIVSKEQGEDESRESSPESGRKYVLRDGVDVLFNGIRINNATLTDELAEAIIARGFEKRLFV